MLTKPIDEITFEDVENVCKEHPEGVQVEYKREVKAIPKIVSSFANTHGGIFIIGVEVDKINNSVIFPIQGITPTLGIEEQILQSALMGVYPAVVPEVKIFDVPNSEKIVIMVRVDASVQAPHAVEKNTKVYFRVGSITQPYKLELADMDRIEYMFKRREDSQQEIQQILSQMEKRAMHMGFPEDHPSITVTALPVFPYRPAISKSSLYELYRHPTHRPKKVAGGVCFFIPDISEYAELNEYGIVYQISELHRNGQDFGYDQFVECITNLIKRASELYEACEYLGNIEVRLHLRQVLDRGILLAQRGGFAYRGQSTRCSDTEFSCSEQCLMIDLHDLEKRKKLVEDLTVQLIWPFNIPADDDEVRKQLRERIEYWDKQ